jgi:hypothetical protein
MACATFERAGGGEASGWGRGSGRVSEATRQTRGLAARALATDKWSQAQEHAASCSTRAQELSERHRNGAKAQGETQFASDKQDTCEAFSDADSVRSQQ